MAPSESARIIDGMTEDDPTAWLGDPVGMISTGNGDAIVSVPPSRRDVVVLSLSGAPELGSGRPVDPHVALTLNGARGLLDALGAAVAQAEEHAGE